MLLCSQRTEQAPNPKGKDEVMCADCITEPQYHSESQWLDFSLLLWLPSLEEDSRQMRRASFSESDATPPKAIFQL